MCHDLIDNTSENSISWLEAHMQQVGDTAYLQGGPLKIVTDFLVYS
jgi:hypothetical protein